MILNQIDKNIHEAKSYKQNGCDFKVEARNVLTIPDPLPISTEMRGLKCEKIHIHHSVN